MKKKLTLFFLSLSVCTFPGCAPSTQGSDAEADLSLVERQAPAQSRRASNAETRNEDRSAANLPVSAAPKAAPVDERVNDEQGPAKPLDMKVANGLERNVYLSAKLMPLLPRRMSVSDAAAGFRNQRQFIAALYVSKNLAISFADMKTRITRDDDRMSLEEALRDVRPETTKNLAKAEVRKAEAQAKDDEDLAKDEAKKAAEQEKLAARVR